MTSDQPDTGRRRLRVALVGRAGLLGDIIGRTLAEESEVEVVGEFTADRLPAAGDADLIVWHEANEAEVRAWLLAVRDEPRVLTTVDDGRYASLWELTPHRTWLGALSRDTLIEAIADPAAGGEAS